MHVGNQLLTKPEKSQYPLFQLRIREVGLALQSQQLSDLVAVLSAKGRADALEQARSAAAEAQGQQNYKTFSTRTGYQPGNVTMFSGN